MMSPVDVPVARRWLAAAALAGVAVSAAVTLGVSGRGAEQRTSVDVGSGTGQVTAPPVPLTPSDRPPVPSVAADPAAYEIGRMRDLEPLPAAAPAAPSARRLSIGGEAVQQPDLYAAELVRRLLTQDYRTDRAALLTWVQAESAVTREPLVIGLIPPELRDRYAVFSVTDTAGDPELPAPIPNAAEWQALALQGGYTTVTLHRVEEPLAWTNAVASGRITDPGVTGRDVTATVVRHTTVDGKPRDSTFSVAMSINLEGPPTTPSWRFVAAITYTAIQVS